MTPLVGRNKFSFFYFFARSVVILLLLLSFLEAGARVLLRIHVGSRHTSSNYRELRRWNAGGNGEKCTVAAAAAAAYRGPPLSSSSSYQSPSLSRRERNTEKWVGDPLESEATLLTR